MDKGFDRERRAQALEMEIRRGYRVAITIAVLMIVVGAYLGRDYLIGLFTK